MKDLLLSCASAAAIGLAALVWLETAAPWLVVPLAGLAALPLLVPYLRRDACRRCWTPRDASLPFCPGCAA